MIQVRDIGLRPALEDTVSNSLRGPCSSFIYVEGTVHLITVHRFTTGRRALCNLIDPQRRALCNLINWRPFGAITRCDFNAVEGTVRLITVRDLHCACEPQMRLTLRMRSDCE